MLKTLCRIKPHSRVVRLLTGGYLKKQNLSGADEPGKTLSNVAHAGRIASAQHSGLSINGRCGNNQPPSGT
jgi:hypothetical protein